MDREQIAGRTLELLEYKKFLTEYKEKEEENIKELRYKLDKALTRIDRLEEKLGDADEELLKLESAFHRIDGEEE